MVGSFILAAASMIAAHASSAAAPAEGFWQAGSGGAIIEVHSCGEALCGRVVDSDDLRNHPYLTDDANRNPALRGRPVKGLDILEGFKGGPNNVWTGGHIYNPDDGRVYHAELKLLAPDRLKVTGCLIFPLCGAQVWRKAPNDVQWGRAGAAVSTVK